MWCYVWRDVIYTWKISSNPLKNFHFDKFLLLIILAQFYLLCSAWKWNNISFFPSFFGLYSKHAHQNFFGSFWDTTAILIILGCYICHLTKFRASSKKFVCFLLSLSKFTFCHFITVWNGLSRNCTAWYCHVGVSKDFG